MGEKKISLTGIKPTGVIHIGNYFGAILPALELSKSHESRYFIADYHALNTIKDAKLLSEYTLGVAASWLACGLDPNKVLFYRQSDVPQTFELTSLLMNFTAKGLMNRAHAYKAVVSDNLASQKEPDANINMGLYTYPVLMAADILLFHSDVIPVGKDQVQHIEIAADIAAVFNHNYGVDFFTIPQPLIGEATQVIPGLDGRKMSKSYGNTIPLFQSEKSLRKQIMKIVTNSQGVEEPKDPDNCNIFSLYKLFASKEEQEQLASCYRLGGMGWGEAKQRLFEAMNKKIQPMREKYDYLINHTDEVNAILAQGGEKAREIAQKTIADLRKIVGITF